MTFVIRHTLKALQEHNLFLSQRNRELSIRIDLTKTYNDSLRQLLKDTLSKMISPLQERYDQEEAFFTERRKRLEQMKQDRIRAYEFLEQEQQEESIKDTRSISRLKEHIHTVTLKIEAQKNLLTAARMANRITQDPSSAPSHPRSFSRIEGRWRENSPYQKKSEC